MKLLMCLLFVSSSIVTVNAQWVTQLSGNATQRLQSVNFVDENTGWVVGGIGPYPVIILKTTNGGSNWFNQFDSINNVLYSVQFINSDTGWAVGGGSSSLILKTINGGMNWFNPTSEIFDYLTSVIFLDHNTGWAVVEYSNGRIIKTTNGGENWVYQYYGYTLHKVFFIDNNTGWAVGQEGFNGYIIRTTNSGLNWSNQTIYNSTNLYSVYFINQFTGWAVGTGSSKIIKSTDGGISWLDQQYSGPSFVPNSVYFTDENNGWVAGGFEIHDFATIINTTNGGSNWVVQYRSYPNNDSFNSIFFLNQNTGWVVGSKGKIMKTTNGGSLVNILETSHTVSEFYLLEQNYPNPFNPVTKLEFGIPDLGFVSLRVFDGLGKEVAVLVNENLSPGSYKTEFNGANYPSGIYYYKLEAGSYRDVKKMILLK